LPQEMRTGRGSHVFGLPLAATGARGGRERACRRESGISCGKDAGCQRFGAWIDGVTGELRAGLRNEVFSATFS
jgi:hypothetical protein